jgi:hypothetical protein
VKKAKKASKISHGRSKVPAFSLVKFTGKGMNQADFSCAPGCFSLCNDPCAAADVSVAIAGKSQAFRI